MIDPVRGPVQFVVRVLEVGAAPVRGLVRLGGDSLFAAVLALLGGSEPDQASDALAGAAGEPEDHELPPAEVITSGLLGGHGRFTRAQVAERAGMGMGMEDARRLWRSLGFPDVGDEARAFTTADVAALTDAAGLVAGDDRTDPMAEYRIDDLARTVGTTVRNVRAYLAAVVDTAGVPR